MLIICSILTVQSYNSLKGAQAVTEKVRWHSDKALSLLFCVSLFFFIITFSVALPIFCRPFYYAHIGALDLSKKSGYTQKEIKEAYDEVISYLTLPNREFSSGAMRYSREGAAHFADCKRLFTLNSAVLFCSALCLAVLLILKKAGKARPFMLGRHSAAFYSACAAIAVPVLLTLSVCFDFSSAFSVFHKFFFPGKTNWMFNSYTDEIINVLPEEFFMNCAVLIGVSILVFSFSLLLTEKKRINKEK